MIIFIVEITLLILLISLTMKILKSTQFARITLNIFNAMWLGGLAFSNLGLYELDKPALDTNIFFVTQVLVFNIAYVIITKRINKNSNGHAISLKSIDIPIRFNVILILNIAIVFMCLPYIPKAYLIYKTRGLNYLRYLVYIQSNEYISNIMVSFLFQWLIQPFFQFVLLLTACHVDRIKQNFKLFLLAVIDLLLEMLLFGGGRRTIIMFLLQAIIFYSINNKLRINHLFRINRKRIGIVIGVIILFILIYSMTAARLTRISVGESLFQYYVGPFIFFDKITNGCKTNILISTMGNGEYTFSFILGPISILGYILFGKEYNSPAAVLSNKLDNMIFIGAHSNHNAQATSAIYFYSDFGPFFSFIGMIIFAFILAVFTKDRRNNRFFVLSIYFSSLAFYSAQTYPFTGVIQYIVIALSILLIRKEESKSLRI